MRDAFSQILKRHLCYPPIRHAAPQHTSHNMQTLLAHQGPRRRGALQDAAGDGARSSPGKRGRVLWPWSLENGSQHDGKKGDSTSQKRQAPTRPATRSEGQTPQITELFRDHFESHGSDHDQHPALGAW